MRVKNIGSNMTEIQTDKGLVLVSYATPVAAYYDNGMGGQGLFVTEQYWSRTTSRHINKWTKTGFHSADDVIKKPQGFFDRLLEGANCVS